MSNNTSVCGCHIPLTPRSSLSPTSVEVGSASHYWFFYHLWPHFYAMSPKQPQAFVSPFYNPFHAAVLSQHHSHSMKASPKDTSVSYCLLQDHHEINLEANQSGTFLAELLTAKLLYFVLFSILLTARSVQNLEMSLVLSLDRSTACLVR